MPVPWSYPLSVTLSATAQLQGREVVWQPFESLELPEPHHVSDVRANRCAPCGGSSLYVVYISKAQHACVSRVGTPVHALRACTTSPIAFLPPGGLLVAGHVTTPLGVMYVIGVGIEGSVGVPVRTGAAVVRMDAPRDSPRLLVAPKLIHLEGWNVGAGTAQSPGACLELQSNIASTPNSDVSLYWRSPAVSTPPALGFFPLSHRLNTWRAGLCSVASPQMRSSGAGCPMRHALALRGGGWEVTPEGTVYRDTQASAGTPHTHTEGWTELADVRSPMPFTSAHGRMNGDGASGGTENTRPGGASTPSQLSGAISAFPNHPNGQYDHNLAFLKVERYEDPDLWSNYWPKDWDAEDPLFTPIARLNDEFVRREHVLTRKRDLCGEPVTHEHVYFQCTAGCNQFHPARSLHQIYDCEECVDFDEHDVPIMGTCLHALCSTCAEWYNPSTKKVSSCPRCHAWECPACGYPHSRPCQFDCRCHGIVCGGLGCKIALAF